MENALRLLKKYWEGQATREEKQWLFDYFKIDDERLLHQLYERYLDDLSSSEPVLTAGQSAAMLSKIQTRIKPEEPVHSGKLIKIMPAWLKWTAAAAIVFIGLFTLIRGKQDQPIAQSQMLASPRVLSSKSSVADTIRLADESVVILYPGSTLTLSDSFNIDTRQLALTGRAHFAVAKDKNRPFTVSAGEITTTAVGTAFTIDALQQQVSIQLHEGKVVLHSAATGILFDQLYLNPGERMDVDLKLRTYVLGKDDHKADGNNVAVTRNSGAGSKIFKGFSFRKGALPDIFDSLSRHFSQPIHYEKDQLKGKMFTGAFPPDDTLENILAVIASLNDLQVQKKAQGFIINAHP
jgi:ferric-dicitrate binding protein FerR (iron transport regulator)